MPQLHLDMLTPLNEISKPSKYTHAPIFTVPLEIAAAGLQKIVITKPELLFHLRYGVPKRNHLL